MSDDFIVEEQERSGGSPFVVLAGILGAVFFLAVICIIAVLATRGSDEPTVDPIAQATSDAIVATNEAVMTQNAFVTQTLIARTLTAAAPTNTPPPTPTSTNTPQPTPTNTLTPTPTETPVVSTGEDGDGGEDGTVTPGEATPTTSIFGTPIFSGGGGATTPTPVTVTGGTGSTGGTGGSGTLPQTGLPLWGIIGLGAVFIVLIGLARRLRAS